MDKEDGGLLTISFLFCVIFSGFISKNSESLGLEYFFFIYFKFFFKVEVKGSWRFSWKTLGELGSCIRAVLVRRGRHPLHNDMSVFFFFNCRLFMWMVMCSIFAPKLHKCRTLGPWIALCVKLCWWYCTEAGLSYPLVSSRLSFLVAWISFPTCHLEMYSTDQVLSWFIPHKARVGGTSDSHILISMKERIEAESRHAFCLLVVLLWHA